MTERPGVPGFDSTADAPRREAPLFPLPNVRPPLSVIRERGGTLMRGGEGGIRWAGVQEAKARLKCSALILSPGRGGWVGWEGASEVQCIGGAGAGAGGGGQRGGAGGGGGAVAAGPRAAAQAPPHWPSPKGPFWPSPNGPFGPSSCCPVRRPGSRSEAWPAFLALAERALFGPFRAPPRARRGSRSETVPRPCVQCRNSLALKAKQCGISTPPHPPPHPRPQPGALLGYQAAGPPPLYSGAPAAVGDGEEDRAGLTKCPCRSRPRRGHPRPPMCVCEREAGRRPAAQPPSGRLTLWRASPAAARPST